MVKDAAEHETEDKKRREAIEARNKLEGLTFSVQKHLDENRDKIRRDRAAGGRAEGRQGHRREQPRAEGRGALRERVRAAAEVLAQDGGGAVSQRRRRGGRAETPAAGEGGAAAGERGSGGGGKDDVIDAEYTEGPKST